MSKVKSEYEVETIFIDQLENIGYQYIDMSNYDDVVANFREQFCKVNEKALTEGKGAAKLSDSEFEKIMLRLENHTVYESAKILREKWVLELDNGKTVYVQFLTDDMDRNTYQVTHQVMACRPNDKYAPKYMGYYINSPTYHNQLLPYMQGIKVTSIGRKNIADTVIYYPADLEEQQKNRRLSLSL